MYSQLTLAAVSSLEVRSSNLQLQQRSMTEEPTIHIMLSPEQQQTKRQRLQLLRACKSCSKIGWCVHLQGVSHLIYNISREKQECVVPSCCCCCCSSSSSSSSCVSSGLLLRLCLLSSLSSPIEIYRRRRRQTPWASRGSRGEETKGDTPFSTCLQASKARQLLRNKGIQRRSTLRLTRSGVSR